MYSSLLPSGSLSLSLSISPHPSLHCIIHSFARAISARTSDFLKLSASLFPRNNTMWDWRRIGKKQLVELDSDEQGNNLIGKKKVSLQLLPIKGIFLCGCQGPYFTFTAHLQRHFSLMFPKSMVLSFYKCLNWQCTVTYKWLQSLSYHSLVAYIYFYDAYFTFTCTCYDLTITTKMEILQPSCKKKIFAMYVSTQIRFYRYVTLGVL